MVNRNVKVRIILVVCCFLHNLICAQNKENEPFKSDYINYVPDFISKITGKEGWNFSDKEMEVSSEVKFYTLNEVEEVNRANALVKVAIESETSGDYQNAMKMYQEIIKKYSVSNDRKEILYRVSPYGVFVPIAQYSQRRLLNFPKEQLDRYRTLYDPEAKELFDEAVKKFSLELFSEIVDKYLGTSYGGKALQFLGDSALDRGNYLEAMEYFKTILDFMPDKIFQTPELRLKIQLCEKALGQSVSVGVEGSKSVIKEKDLQLLKNAIQQENAVKPKVISQKNSSDYISGDDYTRFKSTNDPLGLKPAEWSNDLIGTRSDFFVYSQPVVTDSSIVFRTKNIVYSYSIINGNLRWKNDIGGRSVMQSWEQRQYPLEDIIIQDGMVITPLNVGGSSLVALDEITGQIKWSYGAIMATDGDEGLMRFECAPSSGPGIIYVNYVLDNIKGETHIDTEYGVIAIEVTSGQVKWRRQVCRLQPGKFDASFGGTKRNRIRSFSAPPLYHEGTVYVNTNAGAVAAMDGISGRIKWLIRYPYYPGVHDLTRQFGNLGLMRGLRLVKPHSPMFWLNQRPLVLGEQLYILPVDSPFMFCLDRKTGKVNWSFQKPTDGFNYFLGPISTGELVVTGNGRDDPDIKTRGRNTNYFARNPVYLLDPKTGNINWRAPDYIMFDKQPVMSSFIYRTPAYFDINNLYFETANRPFLMEDDKIIMSGWSDVSHYRRPNMSIFAIGEIDLKNRKLQGQRRYYSSDILAAADQIINDNVSREGPYPLGAPLYYEDLLKLPARTKEENLHLEIFKKIKEDAVPINEYPAFLPFSRITFTRFGVPFELRLSPRKISMVYNRKEFETKISNENSLLSLFAKSELGIKDGDYKKASECLNQCLVLSSPEDVNFRGLIKQQFHRVHSEMVCAAIRANQPKIQMTNTLGMANTASTIAEEVETLFALAEAYIKNESFKNAANCLRSLIEVYGNHEFPISTLAAQSAFFQEDFSLVSDTFHDIVNEAKSKTGQIYKNEVDKALELSINSFPLYLSAVSPLPKELSVRTGDLACLKLIELLKNAKDYEMEYCKLGDTELSGDNIDQLMFHLWKYPNTSKGQEALNRICTLSYTLAEEEQRGIWRKLIHQAKVCKLKLPPDLLNFTLPKSNSDFGNIDLTNGEKQYDLGKYKDGVMITLERKGDQAAHPHLLYVGIKIPKKVGFRFNLACFDLNLCKEVWNREEFRLRDLGNEPGFFNAFTFKDIVLVHGMYDVFAFNVLDGSEIWHYKTPNNFEIMEVELNGNLFVISSVNETIALQADTKCLIGEVAWQQKEIGSQYFAPYFVNDLLISVRKFPFNITSRHRMTGSLMMRLATPELSLVETHPLLKEGSLSFPISKYENYLVVTDGKYLIVYDVVKMIMLWKTLLLNVDVTKEVKIRLEMNDKYIIVVKENFDKKEIYCYSLLTGEILWVTDPVNDASPQAIYSLLLNGNDLYGISEPSGQGFKLVAYDCSKGKVKFKKLVEGYSAIPTLKLRHSVYGKHLVVELQDRKNFEIIIFDKNTGESLKTISAKGDGPIGEIGRISMTIQDGHPILFSKAKFKY